MSNIINAIYNLVNNPVIELREFYKSKNRANSMGDALEEYIKDLFANTINESDEQTRLEKINDTFSYLGNQNNPPDSILRLGDAIEVKKIEGKNASLALNSSYPKHKLYAHSKLITEACRNCEKWSEKDIIYAVGVVSGSSLNSLCMVYGIDYAADNSTYEKIKEIIVSGVNNIPDIELARTNEIAKVKKVDPLGITDLRVRGMWSIENPFKVFDYIYKRDFNKIFNFMCLIRGTKYSSFENKSLIEKCVGNVHGFNIIDVKIKNPNNPALLENAKLITFQI
ncbi:MAG: NgoPII family restriction endonuclease [Anaerococcus hydrogenalis]|uniref:NgoPII family restriction endonuclease n=1 Tax=Anaerococcus TaxID=165779 RepID=UPI0029032726|nr:MULTISPECIES: NgoPII family restriction endonuclease [Anaerococcus]MDU2582654.1 NgoPII family restriction endonuclease [Anaerococcus hydrogenalis]MDU3152684.1 NgoPII family restriction endonuclease [Anaerococcus hydrogenalis]MDU3212393.1 NgoPII family restriction endonuclease [Anaerococcus sp.]MDU3688531.1 NgoPII family restriction endonuclease [Anaerococcus hydrogenalis]